MKLKPKYKVAIIISMIPVLGGIITTIILKNKKHNDFDKSENINSISVVNDIKQPLVKEVYPKIKESNKNILDRISTLEKLKKEGNDILNNYNHRKKDFNNWKSACEGVLSETDVEIDTKLKDIEKSFATFDYHSQIIKIIELLDTEIFNQKNK